MGDQEDMKPEELKERLEELVYLGREIQANIGDRYYKDAAQKDADKAVGALMKELLK